MLNNKIFITLFLVSFSLLSSFSQNFTFNSQADVDGFDNSITTITGDLVIESTSITDPITNLTSLLALNSVEGDFSIINNSALTNLSGLVTLYNVSGRFRIQNNESLTDLDGLSNLTILGERLFIHSNNSLTNIDGLSNLVYIEERLSIRYNPVLNNLNGLANLSQVGDFIGIRDNEILSNCCAIKDFLNSLFGVSVIIENNSLDCGSSYEVKTTECENFSVATTRPCVDSSDGSIYVQIIGASAPFSYNWQRVEDGQTGEGNNSEADFFIENLAEGTYNLTVTDAVEQNFIKQGISLLIIPGSVFEITEMTTTNSSNNLTNGSVSLSVSGGTSPYRLQWSGAMEGSKNEVVSPDLEISYLLEGNYELTVSDDVGNQQRANFSLANENIPILPCSQTFDLVILNDISGSVDDEEYEQSQVFFVDFLNAINIGTAAEDSRAAIVEWSNSNNQTLQIPMTGDISLLQDYVNYNQAASGSTNPSAALNFGKDYLESVARPNAERVLVLATDANNGEITPGLIVVANQLKAAGYRIITIAFEEAFSNPPVRKILQEVASLDILAPGAPSYAQLNQNLAESIVQVFLCPTTPGSSEEIGFHRDGSIEITDVLVHGNCPNPDSIDITFTIEALQDRSIPSHSPVTFYQENPMLSDATPLLTWQLPCEIMPETTETFSTTLPVVEASNIFAVFNDDGSQNLPLIFPITTLEETSYTNNIGEKMVCDSLISISVTNEPFTNQGAIPNIFSPNGDGENDCFQPYFSQNIVIQEFRLQIYNRCGLLVYNSTDYLDCWDGNFEDKAMSSGVYVWRINLRVNNRHESFVFHGDLSLVR